MTIGDTKTRLTLLYSDLGCTGLGFPLRSRILVLLHAPYLVKGSKATVDIGSRLINTLIIVADGEYKSEWYKCRAVDGPGEGVLVSTAPSAR